MPSLPRSRYQLKMATTREELDENNTSKTNSKKATQLFRKTTDNIKIFKESGSPKDSKNGQFSLDLKSTWEPQKQGHQNSYSLNSNLDEADTGGEGLGKQRTSYKLTSTLSSSSNPKQHFVNSREAGTSSNSSAWPMGEENSVGKSFKDTFAFLKNTRHYEEAEAKMKEIESVKLPAVTKITVPNKPKPNAIQVNPRQKGNPVLKFIRCVPWEYSDIVPDYVMGGTTCALFLSLRYHHFNPNYIHERLRLLGKSYELRIILVLVDVKDPHQTLRELAKMAIMADLTLMLTWSSEEAGKYLETYKVYENKPVDALQGQNDRDYFSKLQDCLTTVKGINKTDVLTLNSTFGSLAEITKAPKDDLVFLPGFGPLKAKRLQNVFHEPFLAKKKKSETASSAEKPD